MWQRIQTLFLGLVAIIMIVGIFLPLWRYVEPASGVRYELYPLHYSIITGEERNTAYIPYAITAILMIAAATVAVMTIRRFDNRLLQIKLGAFNSLILMGVVIAVFAFTNKLTNEYNTGGGAKFALWTIFAAVAFNWIALRFIRRDEKIVRDSDRLR